VGDSNTQNITGMCVSPGRVEGIVRQYDKTVKYAPKDIVILNEWVVSNVAYLSHAGGLLSNRGGITCHASIISREYKIPCLVAVRNLDQLKDGDTIALDATNESVTILES